jgi:hypothetical protein
LRFSCVHLGYLETMNISILRGHVSQLTQSISQFALKPGDEEIKEKVGGSSGTEDEKLISDRRVGSYNVREHDA